MIFLSIMLWTKIIAAGFCAVYAYFNTTHKTSPHKVWWMFFGAFAIWFAQLVWAAGPLYHMLGKPELIVNNGVLTAAKLILLTMATVSMNHQYKLREK